MEALCVEHQTNLAKDADSKTLGEWTGVCKNDWQRKWIRWLTTAGNRLRPVAKSLRLRMSSKSKSSVINEQILRIQLIKKCKITHLMVKVMEAAPTKRSFEILVTVTKLGGTPHNSFLL